MLTYNKKNLSRKEFTELQRNMIVYENAILRYDEARQELVATVFSNDEKTQKILAMYGLEES